MAKPTIGRRARVTSRRQANKTHDVGAPDKRPTSGGRGKGSAPRHPSGFAERHPILSLAFAIIGALALIAIFTDTGEGNGNNAQPDTSALETELDRLSEDVNLLAAKLAEPTDTPEPTATPEPPTATPCEAPTLVACGERPTPDADAGRTPELCRTVTALMRTVSQGFDPNGELPSTAMLGKLGKVNDAVCTASVSATEQELCLAVNVAVDAVFERADKEPDVLSLEQMDTLRAVSETVC